MSEPRYDISDAERHECFGVTHDGPTCDNCGEPTTEHGTCPGCVELLRELEADDVWPVWLASLKFKQDQDRMEAVSNALTGWKYMGGDIQHERTTKGISIASANNLRFLALGHRGHLIFIDQNGLPVVVVCGGEFAYPDWTASFTAHTPLEIILAACNAVIHQ